MGTTKHTRRISLLCRAPLHRLINRGVRKSLVPIASVARGAEKTKGSRLGAIALRYGDLISTAIRKQRRHERSPPPERLDNLDGGGWDTAAQCVFLHGRCLRQNC